MILAVNIINRTTKLILRHERGTNRLLLERVETNPGLYLDRKVTRAYPANMKEAAEMLMNGLKAQT